MVFITGAGVSVASGIPTYRGNGSNGNFVYEGIEYTNQEIATYGFLKSKPVIFWERYYQFYDLAIKSTYNKSHASIS